MTQFLVNIRNFLGSDILYQLCASILIIIIAILISKLLSLVTKKIIQPFVSRSESQIDDKLLEIAEKGIFRFLIVAGFWISLDNFRSKSLFMLPDWEVNLLEDYPYMEKLVNLADSGLYIALVFILLLLVYKVISLLFDWYAVKTNADENRDLSGSLFPLLKKVTKVIAAAVAIVIVLSKFNVNISGLLVSLGVGSLAIALAAQDTLSNMIAGFILMIDRPFRIGDRIRYADNQIGDVVSIGIRSTKILDFDNNLVIIPNNEMTKSRVINITYPNIHTRVVVEVGVAYGTDIKKAREIMLEIARNHELTSTVIEPEVHFMNFGESSVDLRLVCRTEDYKNAFSMQVQMRESIYNAFMTNNIEIPFPQRVVHLQKEQNDS